MNIPPLSQSKQQLLACPYSYVEQVIHGRKQVTGEAARRGTAIHQFLNWYVKYLCQIKQSQNLPAWDEAIKGMAPDAREILDDMRDDFKIDPEAIFATEKYISLNAGFEPFEMTYEPPEKKAHNLGDYAYEMTLDLIELVDEVTAKVTDYKSQFQAIDADTFQARLYSLGLMMLNPQIQTVTFELKFLRYGAARSVKFTREDIPRLQTEASQWREVQLKLHEGWQDKDLKRISSPALPGNHCAFCPLLNNGCPIEDNDFGTPDVNLKKAMYHKMALKKATDLLKPHCDANGTLTVSDGIGNQYSAGWEVQERKSFSIDVLPCLLEWDKEHKSDPVIPKLTVSGLTSLLKAKKRSELADEAANFAEVKPTPRFRIGKVGEKDDDE